MYPPMKPSPKQRSPKSLDEAIDEEPARTSMNAGGAYAAITVNSRALSLYSDLEAAFNEAAARQRPSRNGAHLHADWVSVIMDNGETGLALDRFEQAMALYQEIGDLANLLDALETLALNSMVPTRLG